MIKQHEIQSKLFPYAAGTLAIIQGMLLFIGLKYNITTITSVAPGFISMSPATASCLILSGICVILLNVNKSNRAAISLYILSAIIILIGLFRVVVYLIPDSAFITSMFAVRQGASIMAPNTAIIFILFGASFILINTSGVKSIITAQVLLIFTGFLALLALVGYVYGIASFYSFRNGFPMALNTAILLMIISTGTLFIKSDKGLISLITSKATGGAAARRLLPIVVVLPLALGWIRIYGEKYSVFDPDTGMAIFVVVIIAVFFVLVLINTHLLNNVEIHRIDAEKEILERDKILKAIIDNSPAAIYIKDLEGRFVIINKRMELNHGITGNANLGKTLKELFPENPEAVKLYELNNREVLSEGKAIEYEEEVLLADGMHTYLTLKFLLYDDNNKPYATCGISTDINDRKKAENKMNELNGVLEESNKELESFSYSISHDLRAPLRHIIGFGEKLKMLTGDKASPEEQRLLEKVTSSAAKMARLIDDLLMFSRFGRTAMNKSVVDMNLLFHEAASEYSDDEANITWEFDELDSANADPFQLKIVVSNLLSNAVKYTSKKEKRFIKISSCKNENEVKFSVKDNGTGFDMKYRDKLFGVFQRLHNDNDFEGTGIGLATVRRIISKHGGKTWAEGKPGIGSIFHFSIPVNKN